MNRLKGKFAVITGGNSGIGFATAKLFLEEGAHVIITGRREEAVNDAVTSLGPGAKGIVSDAGKMSDVKSLPDKIKELTSSTDILFANAGVALFAPFEQTSEKLFDDNLDINFKGVFFSVQGLLPLIPEGGSVILNSTILVHSGLETSAAYSASKGAILSLSKTLAIELAGRKIRVNTISPGPISTPIYSKMGMEQEVLEEFAAGVMAKIPLKRFGDAHDVAQAALFLASAESNFMTGTEISVDGGKSKTF
ncbi:MAG TPA: SDR family oxidoreductase [Cyclobacteriaceae bacterium]|nr:SDR family oxidoreductase [Cyclobacteriaceae bacterium]